LAGRITTSTIDVSSQPYISGYGFDTSPAILGPTPSGGSKLAWADFSGTVHVTALDANDQHTGTDATLTADEVHGLVAQDDGTTVLVKHGDVMALEHLDSTGSVTFNTPIVGGNDHTASGDKWVDSWPHEGRIAWSGSTYAVYFGHTQNWGAEGNHQGDLYYDYDNNGSRTGDNWDWGCSHSLDVRLALSGSTFGAICLGDCYPGGGIWFNHNTAEATINGTCTGFSDGQLGTMVADGSGFAFVYTAKNGANTDVHFRVVDSGGGGILDQLITNTDGVDETLPNLAHYGSNFIVGYSASSAYYLVEIDGSGNVLMGPETVTQGFGKSEDFINFANGDVGWRVDQYSSTSLTVARLRYCE
jgi:hypothetical protein